MFTLTSCSMSHIPYDRYVYFCDAMTSTPCFIDYIVRGGRRATKLSLAAVIS